MNFVWPNVFETSPHVVQAFMGAIEGMRVGLGPEKVLNYALQVNIGQLSYLIVQHRVSALKKQSLIKFSSFFA